MSVISFTRWEILRRLGAGCAARGNAGFGSSARGSEGRLGEPAQRGDLPALLAPRSPVRA